MTRRAATVGVSLAGLPFIVPHVVEDFAEGIAHRVGLATVIWVSGLVLSQGTAAALAWRGWRRERAP